jgi:hypothetical protein
VPLLRDLVGERQLDDGAPVAEHLRLGAPLDCPEQQPEIDLMLG